jgi:hypothetical protein
VLLENVWIGNLMPEYQQVVLALAGSPAAGHAFADVFRSQKSLQKTYGFSLAMDRRCCSNFILPTAIVP